MEKNEYPHCKIQDKPDIINLYRLRQISGIQQDLVSALSRLTTERITQEVVIPNTLHPAHPFRIDLVVGDESGYQLAVEVDGMSHRTAASIARDKRKQKEILAMGYDFVRLPYNLPHDLIYGRLSGTRRECVRLRYEIWRERWIVSRADLLIKRYKVRTERAEYATVF